MQVRRGQQDAAKAPRRQLDCSTESKLRQVMPTADDNHLCREPCKPMSLTWKVILPFSYSMATARRRLYKEAAGQHETLWHLQTGRQLQTMGFGSKRLRRPLQRWRRWKSNSTKKPGLLQTQ